MRFMVHNDLTTSCAVKFTYFNRVVINQCCLLAQTYQHPLETKAYLAHCVVLAIGSLV